MLALCMSVVLMACGGGSGSGSSKGMETEMITVDGIYADTSSTDEGKTAVYVFYTVKSPTENIQNSSTCMSMVINDTNTYENVMLAEYKPIYTNYCYSSFLKDVNVGTNFKMCSVFEVPEGDLTGSKSIALQDSYITDIAELSISTDDIKVMDDSEAIAQDLDSTVYDEKYQVEKTKTAKASEDRVSQVRSEINGYQWEFYPTLGTTIAKYVIEFQSPNKFYISNSYGLSNNGVYKVREGVIILDYPSGGSNPAIGYTFDSGKFKFTDLPEVFSTYVDYDPLGEDD